MFVELGRSPLTADANNLAPLIKSKTTWQKGADAWMAASIYLTLPGLRGYWPLTAINGAGNYVDQSGIGLHLTQNVSVNLVGDSALQGFAHFTRASNTYLSHTDDSTFDITGTETYVNSAYQGLTVGAWVNPITLPSANMFMIAKWAAGTPNQYSYALLFDGSNQFSFSISNTGADVFTKSATVAATVSTWHFVVGRYQTSTPEVNVWVNDTEYINTTSIPASIYSGTSIFTMGSHGAGGDYLNAFMAHAFLCCAALPDDMIKAIYRRTKGLFGL